MRLLLLLVLCCASQGCSSLPGIVRELAKDPATANLRITTIYGTLDYTRINASSNTLPHSISRDGSVVIGGKP